MHSITLPFTEECVRALRAGDSVTLTGRIYTARDAAHRSMVSDAPPAGLPDVRGGVLYHCGPVTVRDGNSWKVVAAGPTTSIREEPYMAAVIRKYGIRAIIGKGGMGEETLRACREFGCVYLHAVGGAAQVIAESIRRVTGVYMLDEFGAPEALWELEVERFPAIVTMDAHGNSLHEAVRRESAAQLKRLMEEK